MQINSDSLKIDLYELTMAAAYFQNKVDLRATFELFCYKSPPERSYFIACGLEQAVDFVLNLRFREEDVDFIKLHPSFRLIDPKFFGYLKNFRFSGDLWAVPEGEIFFANEPIVQIEAPIIEAQVLETYLLSMMHIQSLVAAKASRVVRSACSDGKERAVIDFGSRRAHGPEAGVLGSRAAYIGGCLGTSNLCAGKRFGIPTYGTMAHSWVESFDTEEESFIKYYEVFPENTVLLIDTYDTIKSVRKVVQLKKNIKAVRLDSGDLVVLSKKVRSILDKNNLRNVKIIASGSLDEYKIQGLVKRKAPIDFFGVGTEMVTSGDLPSLDLVYKLVQVKDREGNIKFKAKTSEGKSTVIARKQVFRRYAKNGLFSKDIIGLFSENCPKDSRPLLGQVIKDGELIKPLPDITAIRNYVKKNLELLPPYCLDLKKGRYLKTEYTETLRKLQWKNVQKRRF